ncbi:2-hydroxychromene-2-carboxylate isomerase [Marinobacter algicola]|uniref:2-hydroxychromene-2-carboxylate isomerase n=1 Tax=Marinobacter algicola DG893 TaxID=443152 RepID=A6F0N9_9GAMM|nr:2-hydroxychromene-2-carboxylate isomerase [Marinobacter algicola]EDM47628.1 putative 2-hydroxychromene-2-carboxylate isomerase [Marinobacter algicola DG893]
MTQVIDFYFDVGSPASYLAWTQLPTLAQRTHSDIRWKPMLLGGVFKATGNQSPAMNPTKSRYTRMDMERFARAYGVPLNFNPHFPINTLLLMRGAVGFLGAQEFHRYLEVVFRAMWVDQKNMNDPEVAADVLYQAGFNPDKVLALCEAPSVKAELKQFTEEAVERGIFGAPTFFVGDEMFFGQDRMPQLENHLSERQGAEF